METPEMHDPVTLTADEAVLLDNLFRDGPRQTGGSPEALALINRGLAKWADTFGTIEITEAGRNSAGVYRIGSLVTNDISSDSDHSSLGTTD